MKKSLQFTLLLVIAIATSQAQTLTIDFSLTSPAPPLVVPYPSGLSNVTFSVNLSKPHSMVVEGYVKIYAQPSNSSTLNTLYTSINITSSNWSGSGPDTYLFTGSFNITPSQLSDGPGTIFARFEADGGINYNSSTIDASVSFPAIVNNEITATGTTSFVNSGDPALISGSSPAGGNGTYAYQWQSSITNASSGFSNISGATSISYNPPVINSTTYYRRVVTSAGQTSTSNVVTFSVTISISNNFISAQGATYFTDGSDPSLIGGTIPSGGNGSYSYQWQLSTTSETSGFANINGATSINYDPPAITTTSFYRRLVNSSGAPTSNSNVIAISILRSNVIHFGSGLDYSNKYYYARPVTPPTIGGELITGTTSTIEYFWVESNDGANWHAVFGSDGSIHPTSSIIQTTYYARQALIRDGSNNVVFTQLSNVVIAYIFDPISNNSVCCDQTVYGTSLPSVITGTTPVGGIQPLDMRWQTSTDNVNWTDINGGVEQGKDYQPPQGQVGNIYFRRMVRDHSPVYPPYISYSNSVLINYQNIIPIGATFTNPFPSWGTWTSGCAEYLQTVNSLSGNFSNQYGGPDNDVFFKINSNITYLGVNSCSSTVHTKLYLFDSNFNLMTLTNNWSDCQFTQSLPVGTFYLIVEGNGIINLQMATYVYGDCADQYTGFPAGFLADTNMAVYPNPAMESVNVKLSDKTDKDTKNVRVHNKFGTMVKSFETKDSELNFSVTDLPADIYYIKVITRHNTATHRLVIK